MYIALSTIDIEPRILMPKRLEVAARYSSVDPNRDKAQDQQIEVTGAR